MVKQVEHILAPREPHFVGDGFRVHNFIPGVQPLSMQRMDPFIMLDYNSLVTFPPAESPRGVGVHPHRGFETVTIAYKGRVEHHDSTGAGGIIGEGDVQWMTAGAGILHKEFHEKEWSKQGGPFQMVQLWVNLPAKHKREQPGYQSITKENIVKVPILAEGDNVVGQVEVIAGNYKGQKGPAHTFSPIQLMNVRFSKPGKADFSFVAGENTGLLVIEGSVKVNGSGLVQTNHFVLLGQAGEDFTIESEAEALVLILSGEPLHEPIAAHGPFVMNTKAELMEAFEDYQNGKFGKLD